VKKIYIAVPVLFLICLLVVAYGLFQVSKLRNFQFFGDLTSRVNTDKKVVALTFDDAPSEYTGEVLKTLNRANIKATFFAIGTELERHPMEGKAIAAAGHEFGNHSYSHPRFYLKSQEFIDSEITKTNSLIRATGYKGEITFRPPYGKKLVGLPYYLSQHGIKTIMWDVEPDSFNRDPESGNTSKEFIVKYTLDNTKPGSIILLHPFCKTCNGDREALLPVIEGLKKKGYQFVTVSDLLKYDK
jgi:chitin deacetylase